MFSSPGPIAFTLGPIAVHWYGIIIGTGIVLCYLYVISELKRRKIDHTHIDGMALWVIFSGIIGARLYYVLFNFNYFSAHLSEILQIWKGGLAIHGALLGGALAFFIYLWRHKLSWTLYADIVLPGVLLAQGLGRWGNFFNNEAFGGPTDLPWKLFIPPQFRPSGYENFSYYHPTFLYESLWNLIGFALLIFLTRKLFPKTNQLQVTSYKLHRPTGIIFFGYLMWYSLGRFFIEGLRLDSLYLGPLRIAQVMSAVLFFVGVFGLLFLLKKHSVKRL